VGFKPTTPFIAADDRCVTPCDIVEQCQRAGRGRHRVGRFDIVFEQHRNTMQGAARTFAPQFLVERLRLRHRSRIDSDYCAQLRAVAIDRFDPLRESFDESDSCGRAGIEIAPKLTKRASVRGRLRRVHGLQRKDENDERHHPGGWRAEIRQKHEDPPWRIIVNDGCALSMKHEFCARTRTLIRAAAARAGSPSPIVWGAPRCRSHIFNRSEGAASHFLALTSVDEIRWTRVVSVRPVKQHDSSAT
jgi:hypothetical protein